jgi:hypothetical protein
MGGTKCRYAIDKPMVLYNWHVQEGTNFSQYEVKFFEEMWFVFNKQQPIHPLKKFGDKCYVLINQPTNAIWRLKIWNGKVVWCTLPFMMSKQHYNRWEVGWLFDMTFKPPLEVPTILKYGQIYNIIYGQTSNNKQYEVTIGNFFVCTYMDFVITISNLLGMHEKWVPCKHMYYVTYCSRSCFVGSLKISFISWLGVVMKFVTCWFILLLLHR